MIKIQKLVLKNFKSFQKAEIPISNGFTAIAGSNGSGKTNILDALIFALGTNSLKSLRAAKLTDLVNNSAAENYAKVELYLKDGSKGYVVQRMIDKHGKCVYRLNDERKTRDEISALLLELGIKPDGHNIVVQGDTTRVIEMSPEERRQIIDEVAGLQEFDQKKEEALKELGKVEIRLRDANIVLSEREHYLEQLQKEKEAAAQFEELQKEAGCLKATRLYNGIESITKEQDEYRARAEKACAEKEKAQAEVERQSKLESELREKANELNSQLLSFSEKTYATVGAQLEGAKTERGILAERAENRNLLLGRNSAKIAEIKARVREIDAETAADEAKIREIDKSLPGLNGQIAELLPRKSALEQQQLGGEEKSRQLQMEEEKISSELRELNESKYRLIASLNSAKKERELHQQMVKELAEGRERLRPLVEAKEKSSQLLQQLRKKFPGGLAQLISAAEKESEDVLSELKGAEAEERSINEGITALQKSYALCPVCESRIDKAKKESLVRKKAASLRQIMEMGNLLRAKRKDLEAKKTELRGALEKEAKLALESGDLGRLAAQFGEGEKKISELKAKLQRNEEMEKAETAISRIENSAKEKESALLQQGRKRRDFSESVSIGQLQKASNRLAGLEREEQRLNGERQHLEAKISQHLEKQRKTALAEMELLENENRENSVAAEKSGKSLGEIGEKISGLEEKLGKAEKENKELMREKVSLDEKIARATEKIKDSQVRLRQLDQQDNSIRIELSKQDVRLADLRDEFKSFEQVERVKGLSEREIAERLGAAEKKIGTMGPVNMKAIESFKQLADEVKDVRGKVEQLEKERLAVLDLAQKIEVKRANIFMQCFEALNKNFSGMFFNLFGGEGRLGLTNPENPLESGLMIEAKHKGESIKNIDSMSGGEKTLTALAFLFAIQLYEPSPFYVFDEADAALDKENSEKVASLIKQVSRKGQFIAITHNDPLIQKADQIIGVALNKQKSSVIGLKLREQMEAEESAVA